MSCAIHRHAERGPRGSDTSACGGAGDCGRTREWRRRDIRGTTRGLPVNGPSRQATGKVSSSVP